VSLTYRRVDAIEAQGVLSQFSADVFGIADHGPFKAAVAGGQQFQFFRWAMTRSTLARWEAIIRLWSRADSARGWPLGLRSGYALVRSSSDRSQRRVRHEPMWESGPYRLGNLTSPYLHQHAANPVGWWPWSEAALVEARVRDVPVLGYYGRRTS